MILVILWVHFLLYAKHSKSIFSFIIIKFFQFFQFIFFFIIINYSFHKNYNQFPLVGTLDDMVSKTDTYVDLRRM